MKETRKKYKNLTQTPPKNGGGTLNPAIEKKTIDYNQ